MRDYQEIRRLYFEDLTGVISEEDYERLQRWLKTDERARIIWSELEHESKSLQMDTFLNNLEPEQELEKLEFKKSTVTYDFPWKFIAAAMLVMAVGGAFYFGIHDKNELDLVLKPTENISQEQKGIRLTRPDGQIVSLSESGVQDMEGVSLNNIDGTLTYSGGKEEIAFNELYIPAKEDYEIVLDDGTRVFLNSESKLKFPFHFSGNQREVYIDGEAFFDVKKDQNRPFVVHTSLADIEVTGTSFNVNTYDKQNVKTALLEGGVQVNLGQGNVQSLSPGFEMTVNTEKTLNVGRFDPEEVMSWRSGVYYFHNKKLGELKGFIERWYGVKLILDIKNNSDYTVSGLLEKGKLQEFLTDLTTTSGINHRFEGNNLYLE